MAMLDNKRQRNGDIFQKVSVEIEGKTMQECRTKFKLLKNKYKKERTAAAKSGIKPDIVY